MESQESPATETLPTEPLDKNEGWTVDPEVPFKRSKTVNGLVVDHYRPYSVYVVHGLFDGTFCDDVIDIIKTVPLRKTTYGPGENTLSFVRHLDHMLADTERMYYPLSTHEAEMATLLANAKTYGKTRPEDTTVSLRTNQWNGVSKATLERLMQRINKRVEMLKGVMKSIAAPLHFDHNQGFQLRKLYGPTKRHSDGCHFSDINPCCLNYIAEKGNKGKSRFNNPLVRNSSAIVALNDRFQDKDGGIFYFPEQELEVHLPRGSMIIFPPFWTHPHEVSDAMGRRKDQPKANTVEDEQFVNEPDRGYRYTLSTWFCEHVM